MKSYSGFYSSTGRSPVECTVLVFDKVLSIGYRDAGGANTMVNWHIKDIDTNFDFTRQCTRLKNHKLPGELMIDGKDAASFVQSAQAEIKKPLYKKSGIKIWVRISMLFTVVLGLLVLLYLLIVPWLSQKLASNVSVKTEQQFGNAVYDALDLKPREDSAASVMLNDFFKVMDIKTAYDINIVVVNNNVMNAFALPGGRIVVYRKLLDEIKSYPELAALLSHEYTHVNNKHTTKSIFRKLGSKVFLGLLFGRFGTVTNVMINNADNLTGLKYSRSLEKEADINGLDILMKRKIDTKGFTDLFENLKKSSPGNALPEFLVSHPDIDKRISYIKEASENSTTEDNKALKGIFEKLKSSK